MERVNLEENQLIERILAGEKELYGELIQRNNQTLYRIVKSYVQREYDVEEIMEVAFVKAYEGLSTFKQKSSFSTWLIRIAINEALQFNRKNAKLRSIDSSDMEFPDRSTQSPEQEFIMQEATRIYESAISALDPIYKSVFMLKEINQMSIKDIAECLEISETNVKVRLHRAKSMVKESLYSLQNKETAFEYGNHRCSNMVLRVMNKISKL